MEHLSAQDPPVSLLGVPFNQKWNLLKPTIERLYVHDDLKLSEVISTVRDRHGFDATESQYKYQIKKWKMKKSTSTTKKAALYQVIQKRANLGKSSAVARGGKNLDTKNLRRYLKTEARRTVTLQPNATGVVGDTGLLSRRVAQFGNRIFMNWNMPYGTMMPSTSTTSSDHVSPLSDMVVATPSSQQSVPSPTAIAVKAMTAVDGARLFTQGRHNELLKSMEKQQRITMSTWMYQFWYFSFKTAKHWGRGPQDWTAGMLGFDDYHQQKTISGSSPNTPGMSVGTPATHFSSSGREMSGFLSGNGTQTPSSLCRWSIHCKTPSYKRIPSPPSSPPPNLDLDNEQAWPQWSGPQDSDTFTKKLSDNLASNDFSNVKLDNLPVATNQIAVAAQRSPKELRQEALGFSIMSGNVELIVNIIENIGNDLSSSGLFPFHLAVSYLNGSRQCCNVLNEIQEGFPPALRRLYVNDLGHTILDQLMIAILKSHTSCLPSIVDPTFRKEKRFEGEDVDICGRWDADSDCVRRLLANGTSSIPFEWKHMFCHTSVQAICHCIGTVFGPQWAPNINRPSGLFVRRCSHCGDKLELLALHTLVLVGVHLSQSGCEDENLFGILACLLCLLHNGANPLLVANISIPALLGNDESNECEHEDLDPLELAEKVPANLKSKWSGNLSTGWQIICNVLEHSQKQWKERPSRRKSPSKEREREDEFDTFIEYGDDEMSENGEASNDPYLPIKCSSDEDHENLFGVSKILPSLWAAVQTELLTYRRLGEGDGWISQNFDLESLNDSLLNKEAPGISLVQKPMMNTFCACGEFRTVKDGFGHGYPVTPACPLVDEAAAYYFANLEDWNRSSFITCPEDRCESWFY